MQWQSMASRLTGLGFSAFTFGLQANWKPLEPERDIVRRVLADLEDRRVLFMPAQRENPRACEESVQGIRSMLTKELGRPDCTKELASTFRFLRNVCTDFVTSAQEERLIVVERLSECKPLGKQWQFIDDLTSLRKDFGYHIATLSYRYKIDIEDKLAPILPNLENS